MAIGGLISFATSPRRPVVRFVAVCDLLSRTAGNRSAALPRVTRTGLLSISFRDATVDAVAIATPVSTHFALALEALRAGKHVLVEKPLTATPGAGAATDRRGRPAQSRADGGPHLRLHRRRPARSRKSSQRRRSGRFYYYDSVRVNLGLFQRDVNVVWDLAVHDLAILDYVLGEKPWPCPPGISHVGPAENIAYLTCLFDRSHRPRTRQLAGARENPADSDRRRQTDDRL